MCPGVRVSELAEPGTREDTMFGRYVSAWQGWAKDDEIRELGSSGGVLTAINEFLREDDRERTIVATSASRSEPLRSVPVRLTTRAEVEASAGSRYAPVSNLSALGRATADDVFVGKPCEVAAARQAYAASTDDTPTLLSFFCAGTPSQNATVSLVEKLDVDPATVAALRYRGDGWPGEFTVVDESGRRAGLSYHESWGGHLGRDLQWRCKLCAHGTGNHADIAVGDFWRTDDKGYPLFESDEGNSVVIARTTRGHELLLRARASGVLVLEELDLRDVHRVQPLQTKRISTLWARLAARRLAGFSTPRYVGFGLWGRAASTPAATLRTIAGTWLRSLRSRRSRTRR